MTYKYSVLGLAAGMALLMGTGCSKQESPATPAVDTATKSQTPTTSDQPQPIPAPKALEKQPAVSTNLESAITTNPAATITVPAPASATAMPSSNASSVAVVP